jgi:hypothetical protein
MAGYNRLLQVSSAKDKLVHVSPYFSSSNRFGQVRPDYDRLVLFKTI